jgi:hypothetical protein
MSSRLLKALFAALLAGAGLTACGSVEGDGVSVELNFETVPAQLAAPEL